MPRIGLRACLLFAFASLTCGFRPAPLWAEATTQPGAATQPVKVTVTVTVDTTKAPETADWAEKARVYAEEVYPKLAARLPSDGFTPPQQVKLVFDPGYKGVAATMGTVIVISPKWITDNPDDFGMVAHELTHVVQHYTHGPRPGWLVEGIADYVRYYVIEPGSPRARFDINRSKYDSAYQPTAAFLDYLERTYPDKHIVTTLNTAMREAHYKDSMIKDLTGKEPAELWEDFKVSRKKKQR